MPTSPEPKKTATTEAEAKAKQDANKMIEPGAPAANFIANLIGGTPSEPAKPKVDPKPKAEAGANDDEQPPAKPVVKKKATPPAPVIDEEKLGQSIGKSIAEHTAKTSREPAKEEPPKIDPKDARRIAILERMEQLNGERYAGLSKRYSENKTKLREYADKWEKANPGETFDENADEHTDFIEALEAQVAYEDEDFVDAQADIRAEQKFDSKKSELDQRLSKIEESERKRSEAPKIQKAAEEAGNEFWKDMGDDFAAIVTETGAINGKALEELKEADPIKFDIVTEAATVAEGLAATIYALANGIENYDAKNPSHSSVTQFAVAQESAMMQRPEEERRDEQGRMFVRKAEFDRMNKAQRELHWTYSADELTFMATHEIAKRAKHFLKLEDEKFNKRAKARGLIKEEQNREAAPERRPAGPAGLDDDDDSPGASGGVRKPLSPSVLTSPKLAASKGGKADEAKSGVEGFIQKLIG